VLSACLLSSTFLVHPAFAADNQVGTQSLIAINSGDVTATSSLGSPQSIFTGVSNSIGASAIGALGTVSVSQTVANSTVQTGASNSPGNEAIVNGFVAGVNFFGNVLARVTITGGAVIGGGQANSIGASAVGASGNASINQTFASDINTDLTSLDPNHVQVTDGIGAVNLGIPGFGGGAVDARLNAGDATIFGGIGNSILAQAAGSQVNASIISRAFNTSTSASPTGSSASNLLEVGSSFLGLSMLSLNLGDVSAKASLGKMTISNSVPGFFAGIGNSIGSSAVGASAGAGVNQSVNFTNAGPIDLTTLFSNNVQVDGAILSLNGGAVTATLDSPTHRSDALINDGTNNSISAQAVGASAGASISQLSDSAVTAAAQLTGNQTSRNTVSTGALFAGNGGNVRARADLGSANVNEGVSNFIGASAVGASAGAGITQAISNSLIVPGTPLGRNRVTVGAIAAQNGSGAGSLLGKITDTVRATVTFSKNAAVTQGIGNSIGASAVGASAGANINQELAHSSALMTQLSDNTVLVNAGGLLATDAISAINTGRSDVHATVTMTLGQTLAQANSGIGNSVSASAGGASASATIASLIDQSTALTPPAGSAAQANVINTTGGAVKSVFASNNGVVTALFDAAPAGTVSTNALVGISNSVGATAFGASASAGVNQAVSLGSGGIDLPSLFNNRVTTGDITARNRPAGDVTATLRVSGNTTVGNATVTGPIGDSVAAQAVGASATAAISSSCFRVSTVTDNTLTTANKNRVVTGDLTAVNRGDITARASLQTGGSTPSSTIANGVNGFIGASASGASAGAGISQSLASSSIALTNLPGNTVQSDDVTARNFGAVTANLSNPGSAAIVSPVFPAVAVNTIGNTIGAQANGATASASITSVFSNVAAQTTGGTLSANSVTVASLDSTNHGAVSARATFGTTGQTTLVSIGGGIGNTIGASAVGASSVASINQVVNDGVWGGPTPGARLSTLPTNSISAGAITAFNSAPVTAHLATLGTMPTSIVGGIGNTIGASAIGASAGSSISQTFSNIH
jgi:hypothetical protein